MSEIQDIDWSRVASAVVRRRGQLRLSQKAAASRPGSPGTTSWQQLENARWTDFRPSTLARFEGALEWPPGTLEAIGRGAEPPYGYRVAAKEKELERDRLRREITELEAQVAERRLRLADLGGNEPGD